jgi:hypothetical protein
MTRPRGTTMSKQENVWASDEWRAGSWRVTFHHQDGWEQTHEYGSARVAHRMIEWLRAGLPGLRVTVERTGR